MKIPVCQGEFSGKFRLLFFRNKKKERRNDQRKLVDTLYVEQ